MAEFPQGEAEISTLASDIKNGLSSDPIFANPPVTPAQLETLLSDFGSASSTQRDAQAVAEQKTTLKKSALGSLTGGMKTTLDWAVKIPGISEAQLKKIGWGFAAAPSKTLAPAQCPNFRLHNIEGRSVVFDWDKPSYKDGGKPTGYKLYRRAAGTLDSWTLEEAIFGVSATEDEETDFPTGTWEVIVRALNNEGEGPVSNSVLVTVG
ncbi:MAG TPA: fibronectin type III domain-containing protein [Abditibacterium sp.]|jgi:hypothetical protein